MALTINGIKVAGVGLPGKSAYQSAVEAGYTGSESDFSNTLAQVVSHDEMDEALENMKKEVGAQYAFEVNANGHLIMSYTDGATPPNVAINNDGHLILTI